MKKISIKQFLIALLFSLLFFSCNTSIDSIVDDYNTKFTIDYTDSITSDMLSPGDVGFNPTEMLRDEYFLGSDSSLSIAAPPKSTSVQWTLSDPATDEWLPITVFGTTYQQYVVTDYTFSINSKACGLKEGSTYKLTLQVTDQGGLLYTDVCAVVVYKRYNFY